MIHNGTHFTDRMCHILGVCQDCGILWHNERVTYRNGVTEMKRVEDIEPEGNVLVTPQYEKYGLLVNPRLLPRLKTMGMQFAYALNVPYAAIEVNGNVVYVVIPRENKENQTLIFDDVWNLNPYGLRPGMLVLGRTDDGQQMVVDLADSRHVHAAVIGMSGSGKSTLMRNMILSALRIGGCRVALFDPTPRESGFFPFSGHPRVWRGGLFTIPEEIELGLEALAAQTMTDSNSELTLAFIDEVPDLVIRCPRIGEYLTKIAQMGRHVGIHLIMGAQRLVSETVGSSMAVVNAPLRIVGKVANKGESYLATGQGEIGCELLRGNGDFIAVNGTSKVHFQAAIIDSDTLTEYMRRYPPRTPRVPVRAPRISAASTPTNNENNDDNVNDGGRPLDEISNAAISELRAYIEKMGEVPSTYWIEKKLAGLIDPNHPEQKTINASKRRRIQKIAEELLEKAET